MTWLMVKTPSGSTGIEHHAMLDPNATVISRHASYPEACVALDKYRERIEREELEAAGQMELL